MNNDWDPNWWKKKRDESIERTAAEPSEGTDSKRGDSFLIVTEGKVTEPVYFELLKEELGTPQVHVKVIPGKHPDPQTIIIQAANLAKAQSEKAEGTRSNREVREYDQVWAVIDTDVAVREGKWKTVEQLAAEKDVMLAHSTPCIEFWLLLHFSVTARTDLKDGATAKRAVEDALGREYSTNKKTAREAIGSFISKWRDAVQNAEKVRKHHLTAGTPPPANPSTEVDRLVLNLDKSR